MTGLWGIGFHCAGIGGSVVGNVLQTDLLIAVEFGGMDLYWEEGTGCETVDCIDPVGIQGFVAVQGSFDSSFAGSAGSSFLYPSL